MEKQTIAQLESADSMFFLNKKEIDRTVASLSEKFAFHGFIHHAKDLTDMYKEYIQLNLPKNEVNNRLNALKFLVTLSENPTSKLAENPHGYRSAVIVEEEIIDWPAYLKEGIEPWCPESESSDSDWSDDEITTQSENERSLKHSLSVPIEHKHFAVGPTENEETYQDFKGAAQFLNKTVQYGWFNKENFRLLPRSKTWDANLQIHWETFIKKSTNGLLTIDANLISEYKVIREVLWQLFCPHDGVVFKYSADSLIVRENVSIPSVRNFSFQNTLGEFVDYIETLKNLRDFQSSVLDFSKDSSNIPETYRSYAYSQQNILRRVYERLYAIEWETVQQESVMSLTRLEKELSDCFAPVRILDRIHKDAVGSIVCESNLTRATTLLARLHFGLLHCATKLEQDIYITLYIESLYMYLNVADSWLTKSFLLDLNDEFVITEYVFCLLCMFV